MWLVLRLWEGADAHKAGTETTLTPQSAGLWPTNDERQERLRRPLEIRKRLL